LSRFRFGKRRGPSLTLRLGAWPQPATVRPTHPSFFFKKQNAFLEKKKFKSKNSYSAG
jgi:hypothetical protein